MLSLEFLNPNSKISLAPVKPQTACVIAGVAAIITGTILTLALNQILPHGVNAISNMGTGGAVLSYGTLAAGGGLVALVVGQLIKKKVESAREEQKEEENGISEEKLAAYLNKNLNEIPILQENRVPTVKDFKALNSKIIRGTFENQKFIAILMNDYFQESLLILTSPKNENQWTEQQLDGEKTDNPHYFSAELDLNDSNFLQTIVKLETMLQYPRVGFPDNQGKTWYVGRSMTS